MFTLSAQLCPTLCDPMDCSPTGSSARGDSPGKNTGVGHHFPSPGDVPNPVIQPVSPALPGVFFTTSTTWEAQSHSVVSDSL